MQNYAFPNAAGTSQAVVNATLVANAAAAEVARFNVAAANKIAITVSVGIAALTAFNVFGRGDRNGAWIQIPTSELAAYGRSDSSSDYTTTPAGQACVVALNTDYWTDVMIQAASAGAATLTISAGVE